MADLPEPVLIVGAGLLGTSLGLALRRSDVEVLLTDRHPEHVRTATGLGAGREYAGERPGLVVVAVPPDHVGAEVARALTETGRGGDRRGQRQDRPAADPRRAWRASSATSAATRWRAASGPGRWPRAPTLFDGRPWAVVPHAASDPAATAAVTELARLAGASVVRLSPEEHDLAVARTSHLPHLLAVLVAGRLADAPAEHLALSGQGVRDVTRIAGGDPALWEQIVTGNAPAVAGLLTQVRDQLDVLIDAVSVGRPRAARRDPRARRRRHPGDPRQARRSVAADRLGLRLAARPPGRARAALRRRRRQRGQHRGRPHRPRPGPRHGPRRAARRRDPCRPPAGLAGVPRLADPPLGQAAWSPTSTSSAVCSTST